MHEHGFAGSARLSQPTNGFRHEALFYAGEESFLVGTVPFVRDAVVGGEPIMVAVADHRARAIAGELNGGAGHVRFVDMPALGVNPARIIPAWQAFVNEHAGGGKPLRGIGEPAWPGRSAAELVECRRHEMLLNRVFGAAQSPFWLLCPYDTEGLDPGVVAGARCTHPFVAEGGVAAASDAYLEPDLAPGPFEGRLPPPSEVARELAFGSDQVRAVRKLVAAEAAEAGLDSVLRADLTVAVSELATNSVIHGGGGGTVRLWREPGVLVCEVSDAGRLEDPLLGRRRPPARRARGRGLWLVNHLCDLVQIRSSAAGTVIRLHMRLA